MLGWFSQNSSLSVTATQTERVDFNHQWYSTWVFHEVILDGQVLILMEDQMVFSYACLWVTSSATFNFLFIKVLSSEEAILLSVSHWLKLGSQHFPNWDLGSLYDVFHYSSLHSYVVEAWWWSFPPRIFIMASFHACQVSDHPRHSVSLQAESFTEAWCDKKEPLTKFCV